MTFNTLLADILEEKSKFCFYQFLSTDEFTYAIEMLIKQTKSKY
jgi:hypothetical protein